MATHTPDMHPTCQHATPHESKLGGNGCPRQSGLGRVYGIQRKYNKPAPQQIPCFVTNWKIRHPRLRGVVPRSAEHVSVYCTLSGLNLIGYTNELLRPYYSAPPGIPCRLLACCRSPTLVVHFPGVALCRGCVSVARNPPALLLPVLIVPLLWWRM